MFSTSVLFRFFLLALGLSLGLAACSTSGRAFHTSDLEQIKVGQTTLEQASAILDAEPDNIYMQGDGSALAVWAHKASLVTDAIYFRRELWLDFGPDGKFSRVVKSTNVPTRSLQPVAAPHTSVQNAAGPADNSPMGNMSQAPLYAPAVSYSLSPQ
ncbi:hypothetical protein LSG25_05240 [Paralcaligenes sp. KSB-10]|jgi:hypothetical protein|uniref:hypothetical protein n=1 Tax=Paralcaligenes sp. KSB-10 TaxID=2901142 RepID=UPI001E447E03|nr:hypothetical protein [Paralcaligenes sp. KSB-10]UHL65305.1 hypothetical protein LSG25_05240 [Paralcaligenes sp. KSB-10]